MSEVKQFEVVSRSSQHGRSTIGIKCPFCQTVSKAYIWSLCGGGKRCEGSGCDAMFTGFGGAYLKPRKTKKSAKGVK